MKDQGNGWNNKLYWNQHCMGRDIQYSMSQMELDFVVNILFFFLLDMIFCITVLCCLCRPCLISYCISAAVCHEDDISQICWLRSIVVRMPVLAGKLSLSCARLTAGRVTTLWVKRPLSVNQHGQLRQPSLRGRLK